MARKTTTNTSASLEIHVFGAGKGESIVLRCPGGEWGVVDCYTSLLNDSSSNPTLQFLKDRGVSTLEFLCLTHPHDDHFRGMSQLLEQLHVKHFWRFSGLAGRELQRLALSLKVDAEQSEDPYISKSADEFVSVMQLVKKGRDAKTLRQKMVTGYQQLFPVPVDTSAEFQIWSFAPSGNQVAKYEEALATCFTEDGRFRNALPHAHHNSVSVGLLVRFGQTCIVLGGDVERSGWQDALEELQPEHLLANAVKVSHHGSDTGYTDGLWQKLSGNKKKKLPIAILVPYRRFGLPTQTALDHIRQHASKIMVTCEFDQSTTPGRVTAPLKSRLFLRTKLRARLLSTSQNYGRCTLVYDDSGNCIKSELIKPAHEL